MSFIVRNVQAGSIQISLAVEIGAGIGAVIAAYPALRADLIALFKDLNTLNKRFKNLFLRLKHKDSTTTIKSTDIRLMTEEEIYELLIKEHGRKHG